MDQTNNGKVKDCGEFKHNTSVGENGEILYDYPVEIKDQDDMRNYGITQDDCKYLPFNGSEKVRVYFMKTSNKELANYSWAYVNSKHSRGFASTRCMVEGTRKAFIKCPTTNSCRNCPYGYTEDTRRAPVISMDKLQEDCVELFDSASVEAQAIEKIEYEEIRERMDQEDHRIAIAFEAKELMNEPVKDIAIHIGVSVPRVYQLLNRAKIIGKDYRNKNS